MNIVLYCFMGMTTLMDLIKREIPGWMFWGFGFIGVAGRAADMIRGDWAAAAFDGWARIANGTAGVAGSIAVGIVLLILSRAVQGAVGEGDGWFFVVTGLYVSWNVNLGLLCYGLMLCCIYGIILTALGAIKGESVRKKKIPFLPFVSIAGVLMYMSHMWQI